MKNHEIFVIDFKILSRIKKSECYSVENMAGHEAEGRSLEYVGSEIQDSGRVYDYYLDNTGAYWYRTRMRTRKEIVSMEEYIFGRKTKRKPRIGAGADGIDADASNDYDKYSTVYAADSQEI